MVVFSVTEGEDKPLKYPEDVPEARYAVLNKIDLLPYVPFDMALAEAIACAKWIPVLRSSGPRR